MTAKAETKCICLRGVAGTISGGRPTLELLELWWCLLGDESRLVSFASSLGDPSLTALLSQPRLAGSCLAGGRSSRAVASGPALQAPMHSVVSPSDIPKVPRHRLDTHVVQENQRRHTGRSKRG